MNSELGEVVCMSTAINEAPTLRAASPLRLITSIDSGLPRSVSISDLLLCPPSKQVLTPYVPAYSAGASAFSKACCAAWSFLYWSITTAASCFRRCNDGNEYGTHFMPRITKKLTSRSASLKAFHNVEALLAFSPGRIEGS